MWVFSVFSYITFPALPYIYIYIYIYIRIYSSAVSHSLRRVTVVSLWVIFELKKRDNEPCHTDIELSVVLNRVEQVNVVWLRMRVRLSCLLSLWRWMLSRRVSFDLPSTVLMKHFYFRFSCDSPLTLNFLLFCFIKINASKLHEMLEICIIWHLWNCECESQKFYFIFNNNSNNNMIGFVFMIYIWPLRCKLITNISRLMYH